jgi:hypothetical protein
MVALDFPETEEEAHILNLDDVRELQYMLAQADTEEEARRRRKDRIRILFLSLYYPLFMGKYFDRAFRRNPDVDFLSCGPFTGDWIPWLGGIRLPTKYANPPDIPLPFAPNVGTVSYDFVKAQLPAGWTPDLVISCDAGINWTSKPQDGYVATIGTDPHVLDYAHARRISDKFFNMQLCYSQPGDSYLPYAYDPTVHFQMPLITPTVYVKEFLSADKVITADKNSDAVLIGMPYENRIQWVSELRKHGVSVIFENAPIFDEYRELANRARIGLNWSSMQDTNARFFETPAFGLAPVMNQTPDAHLFLTEGEDYLGFVNLEEAVANVLHLKNNPEEAKAMAERAHSKILPHTYDARVEQILQECGLA